MEEHPSPSLDEVEFPQGRNPAQCVEAIYSARDYLREEGPASMRNIVRNVMPDHPINYKVPELEEGDRYRGAWWRRIVKPGLEALDDVESPPQGQSEWRYVGSAADE